MTANDSKSYLPSLSSHYEGKSVKLLKGLQKH